MQVRPVSAIHPMRIRQKPVTAPTERTGFGSASNGLFSGLDAVPAHIAAHASRRDAYHGAHAEYATQLLAGDGPDEETWLERRLHVAQYASAADDGDERSFTISLSA
ncbi:hypothetical protein [Roseibium aggregatum]|nr:hypothetical protein [Roseibium aggregatum]